MTTEGFTPTAEQQKALDAFAAGENLAIQAGAGTGKTFTLEMLARSQPGKSGRYLAFNRAIVNDAKGKFPDTCLASTIHSAAFGAVGKRFSHRLNSKRMTSAEIARRLGIQEIVVPVGDNGETKRIAAGFLAGKAMAGVTNFCQSDAKMPGPEHVPYIDGIDMPTEDGRRTYANNDQIRRMLVPFMAAIWADALDPHGTLRYSHDRYLKAWELAGPKITADYILFDEAQDVSPVMLSIIEQQADHAQLIFVGDSQQSIYGWLGAVDAMDQVPRSTECYLSKSFRFGPVIADTANGILDVLGADLRLEGYEEIESTLVDYMPDPTCVLTRTNAVAVETVLTAIADGKRPHLVGGGGQVVDFAKAARDLMQGFGTGHPELACFDDWGEVQDYVANDAQGDELKLMVKLIDEFGPDVIIDALGKMVSEAKADLIVSTAHKSKGRQWSKVRLAGDFPEPDKGGLEPEELRLLYVAVTRAQHELCVTAVPYFGGDEIDADSPTVGATCGACGSPSIDNHCATPGCLNFGDAVA